MKSTFNWLENTASDLEKFKECFDENDSPRTIEHLKWQYIDGFKHCHQIVALGIASPGDIDSGLSGIYATIQNKFVMNDDVIVGVQSLDTLTSKQFRGKGIFNYLANEVYRKCISENILFVYGFPNKNSVHGFVNKLGWKLLDPIPFLIRPINLTYLASKIPIVKNLSKHMPRISINYRKYKINNEYYVVDNVEYDDKYDNLWLEFKKNIILGIQRDSQYLNWRLARPGEVYRNAAIFDKNNVMQAICIYTIKKKHGGRIGYILDLINRNNSLPEASNLLDYVVFKMTNDKCDAVLSWCFSHSPNNPIYIKSGFLKFPEKLRPIELHFGAKSFVSDSNQIIENKASWYISYMDSDTV